MSVSTKYIISEDKAVINPILNGRRLTSSEAISHVSSLDASKWIKPVESRVAEINAGEVTYMEHNGVVYGVYTIGSCFIYDGVGSWLTEVKQEFNSGKYTERMIPPSGKLVGGTDTELKEEMIRELEEELGLGINCFLNGTIYKQTVSILRLQKSKFYNDEPYVINLVVFDATIKPKHIREEYIEVQDDKKTFFRWLPKKPVM